MTLTHRFESALLYAAHIHAAQKRKRTDIPYISHLLGVASLALEHGADEDEAIAALLHDAVEDQGGRPRLNDIRDRFGDDVAHIVEGCSDWIAETEGEQKPPTLERKERYVEHAPRACESVKLVSAADKLHNARAMLCDARTHGDALWGRFNVTRKAQIDYLRSLSRAYQGGRSAGLARELALVVDHLEAV